jgi:hypothetical protein
LGHIFLKQARFYSSAPKIPEGENNMTIATKFTGLAAAGLLAAGLATSSAANTVSINFNDYADANAQGFVSVVAPGGIELTSTMSITTGASGHLDGTGSKSGLPSGLGSCLDLINGCIGKETDDIDPGMDLLTMNFVNDALAAAQVVTITDMLIRDDFHLEFDGEIDVNGTVLTVVDGALTGLNLVGSSFDFSWISGVDSGDQAGFYVEAITAQVPLPAGILLLGTALGGLGLARRRKAAA